MPKLRALAAWLLIPLIWSGWMGHLLWQAQGGEVEQVSLLGEFSFYEPSFEPAWYTIARDGEVVGFRRTELSEQEEAAEPFVYTEESVLRLNVLGDEYLVAYDLESTMDASWQPVTLEGKVAIGELVIDVRAQRVGEALQVTVEQGENRFERSIPYQSGAVSQTQIYQQLPALSWEVGQERVFVTLDSITQSERRVSVRYLGEQDLPEQRGIAQRYAISASGVEGEAWLSPQGELLRETADDLTMEWADPARISGLIRELRSQNPLTELVD